MSKRAGQNPMDDLTLEEALEIHFAAEPAPEFLTALEQKLLAEQAKRERQAARGSSPAASPSPPFWQRFAGLLRPRPAAVALVLLLVLLVPLLIVGPRRAWAGLQAWLGYVQGVGFVDLEDTRVLLAPAAETRDGVTLRVTEVIAGPEETTVVVESAGLPPEDELCGREGARPDEAFAPLLRLPDGTALAAETFTLRLGRGTLLFPPLPDDVYYATLELPLLPLVPPGAAPENWSLPLVLHPATGELVAELYPQPYRPEGATDTHHGVTLSVLEVAHTPDKTVFTLQTEWQDESWEHVRPEPAYRSLYDDLGHLYGDNVEPGSGTVVTLVQQVQPGEVPPPRTSLRTYDFGPLSLAANRLTFEVPEVEARVPATGTFSVDLGDDPQVGDSWRLDVHLDVTGFPVHLTRAWIGTEQLGRGGDAEERTNLYFYLEPVPARAGRRLGSLSIAGQHPAFRGSGSSGQQVLQLMLAENAPLPAGKVEVQVDAARVAFHGPWQLTWQVPASTSVTPARLHPDQVDAANGISLGLGRVALTDRITAVEVTLADGPEEALLHEILPYGPDSERRELALEDDRLHDYWFEGGGWTWWQPDGRQPPTAYPPPSTSKWLEFPPVRPLAQRLTLQIPAISLARPGEAAFTVDVPEQLTFERDQYDRAVSEPWVVDATFSIEGYDVAFTEARLVGEGPAEMVLHLSGEVSESREGERSLYGLRVGAIVGPHGRIIHGEQNSGVLSSGVIPEIHSAVALHPGLGGRHWVQLRFPVSDPETGQATPGRYQVRLEGINELVEGPWEFNLSLDSSIPDGLTPEVESEVTLIEPYAPAGASDTAGEVTLQALTVAHTAQETAVHAQARWENGFWEWDGFQDAGIEGAPVLRDDEERVYEAISPENRPLRVIREVIDTSQTPTPPPPGALAEDTAWFEPLAPTARHLTLEVERLWFRAEPSGSIPLDLGTDPQFGARWPLDVALDVGGFPVDITGVRLEEGAEDVPFKLVFETEVEQGDRRRLESVTLGLARDVTDFGNAAHSETTFYSRVGKLEPTVSLASLPASPFSIVVDSATMAVEGPWELTWEVPE